MKKNQVFELPEMEEDRKEDIHGKDGGYEHEHDDEINQNYEKNLARASTTSFPHSDYDHDNDLIEIRGGFPEMPTKTVVLTIFLLITGLGFMIAGVISLMNKSENGKTWTFLLFGIFLTIPGAYYSFYLFQAFRAESPEEREEILDQIPV